MGGGGGPEVEGPTRKAKKNTLVPASAAAVGRRLASLGLGPSVERPGGGRSSAHQGRGLEGWGWSRQPQQQQQQQQQRRTQARASFCVLRSAAQRAPLSARRVLFCFFFFVFWVFSFVTFCPGIHCLLLSLSRQFYGRRFGFRCSATGCVPRSADVEPRFDRVATGSLMDGIGFYGRRRPQGPSRGSIRPSRGHSFGRHVFYSRYWVFTGFHLVLLGLNRCYLV